MEKKAIAKYIRLSVEDDREGESFSIANQRMLLDEFIQNHKEFQDQEIREYVDDGYTGTNFNRPAVRRLLEEMGRGEISCILVKDFSRFARDYIGLGGFLERIFPLNQVRFISINDNYDSALEMSGGLEVSFKGILYDLYSRDLSRKIIAVKEELSRQGKLSGGSYPYGYQKAAPYDIDKEAAKVVQKIFQWAVAGSSRIGIARRLNYEQVPTPAMYKLRQGAYGYGLKEKKEILWTPNMVSEILQDRRYTGTLVLNRYRKEKTGGNRTIKRQEEEWHLFPQSHPPLVSEALWQQVQQRKSKKKIVKSTAWHKFYHKIKCGICGRWLYHKTSNESYYYCRSPRLSPRYRCSFETAGERDIFRAVKAGAEMQVLLMGQSFNRKDLPRPVFNKTVQMAQLYEEYQNSSITKKEFFQRKQRVTSLEEKKEVQEPEEAEKQFVACFLDFVDFWNGRCLSIHYNYCNPFLSAFSTL